MDKLPKPNTVANVLERVVGTFGTIKTAAAPIVAGSQFGSERTAIEQDDTFGSLKKKSRLEELAKKEGAFARQLTSDIHHALVGFFKGYQIGYPERVNDTATVQEGLGEILEQHGQAALDAIEGATRLVSKVVLYSYEVSDPRPYVSGTLEVLKGLPLAQLSSTQSKIQVEVNQRTYRDRLSRLITWFGKELSSDIMLELLSGALPQAAARIRPKGQEKYVQFLDLALTYLASVYNRSNGKNLPSVESVKAILSELEDVVVLTRDGQPDSYSFTSNKKLTPDEVAELAAKPDPRAAFESYFGGAIVAIHFTGHSSGTNRQLGFYVTTNGNAPVKHAVPYDTNTARPQTVDVIRRIQRECQANLQPSDPFFAINSAAGRNLHHLEGR